MARHFGENFHQSQCGNMCDVCDALHPAASDDLTQPPVELPNIVTRDLSEAAVQVCEFVVNANIHGTEKGGGKRKRASKTVGTLTQLQLTDECRKRNSAVSVDNSRSATQRRGISVGCSFSIICEFLQIGLPKDLSREDCERLVMELLLQGILRETFKNTAYSTISYIQHDPDLLGALRRGDLLVKLTSVQAPNNAKSAKKPAKKRASKKGTKVEAGVEDDSESQQNAAASQYFPASSSSNQHLNYDDDDDFDIQEPEPEVELDEEAPDVQDDVGEDGDGMDYEGGGAAAASVKPERLKQEQKQDPQDSASQSSEDQPIMRKRLKKAAEVKREAKPSPAAASRSSDAPSRRPSFAPKHSQEDFMDDDDGDAYQAMLLESAQQQ
jgi:hypothetical protein